MTDFENAGFVCTIKREVHPKIRFFNRHRIEDLSNLYVTGHIEKMRESGATDREASGQVIR